MLFTTSLHPCSQSRWLARSLANITDSFYINRGSKSIPFLLKKADVLGARVVCIVEEERKTPFKLKFFDLEMNVLGTFLLKEKPAFKIKERYVPVVIGELKKYFQLPKRHDFNIKMFLVKEGIKVEGDLSIVIRGGFYESNTSY